MTIECLNHKYAFNTPMPVGRLVTLISDKAQVYTQKAEKRPYGVGLLVAGYDQSGAHLYQTDPSGNFNEYIAQGLKMFVVVVVVSCVIFHRWHSQFGWFWLLVNTAMGARSQTSKTYLEKHFEVCLTE